MKCVMVINEDLPLGLIANTAAVLAMTIGSKHREIVGEDVIDRAGSVHSGITRANISMLKGSADLIRALRERLLDRPENELFFVDFCDAAQQSKQYDEYKSRLLQTPADQLNYLGIAIYGAVGQVNKLTGNLGLLR